MMGLYDVVASVCSAFGLGFVAWFFARKKQRTELKSSQADLEIKLTHKYETLLDSFDRRLRTALVDLDRATNIIKERDREIDELTDKLKASYQKIDEFMNQVHELTTEIKKYKQLNGKTENNG